MLTAIELVRTCLLQRPGGRLLNYGRLSHAPLRDDVHMIPANPLLPLWFHGRSGLPVLQIEDQVMKELPHMRSPYTFPLPWCAPRAHLPPSFLSLRLRERHNPSSPRRTRRAGTGILPCEGGLRARLVRQSGQPGCPLSTYLRAPSPHTSYPLDLRASASHVGPKS